jgi:hypothetical protein
MRRFQTNRLQGSQGTVRRLRRFRRFNKGKKVFELESELAITRPLFLNLIVICVIGEISRIQSLRFGVLPFQHAD